MNSAVDRRASYVGRVRVAQSAGVVVVEVGWAFGLIQHSRTSAQLEQVNPSGPQLEDL